LGNGGGVVFTQGASDNLIGGTVSGAGNTISFNLGDGVRSHDDAGIGNAILTNSIHSNDGLGIDLRIDGVTLNDALDEDNGPNVLQNFPELISLDIGTTSTVIRGNFTSTPDSTYGIEFFYSDVCDPSGFGEGQNYLGTSTISTDGSGNAGFIRTFGFSLPPQSFVTATATDQAGNTSEFSHCIHPIASVLDEGDQIITFEPVGAQLRITASSSGGSNPAQVSLCGGITTLQMTDLDEVIVGCGSAHIKVQQGPVEIVFYSSEWEEASTSLEANNSLTFDPVDLSFTAPESNDSTVVIMI
jgi:hypothetical protein